MSAPTRDQHRQQQEYPPSSFRERAPLWIGGAIIAFVMWREYKGKLPTSTVPAVSVPTTPTTTTTIAKAVAADNGWLLGRSPVFVVVVAAIIIGALVFLAHWSSLAGVKPTVDPLTASGHIDLPRKQRARISAAFTVDATAKGARQQAATVGALWPIISRVFGIDDTRFVSYETTTKGVRQLTVDCPPGTRVDTDVIEIRLGHLGVPCDVTSGRDRFRGKHLVVIEIVPPGASEPAGWLDEIVQPVRQLGDRGDVVPPVGLHGQSMTLAAVEAGVQTTGDIARVRGISKSTASEQLHRLSERQLIELVNGRWKAPTGPAANMPPPTTTGVSS